MVLSGVMVYRVEGHAPGARHRIVWTMSGEHTMSLRILNPPALTGSFHPGLFGVRFGPMPFDRATRAFPRTCSYSVNTPVPGASLQGDSTGFDPFRVSQGLTGPVACVRVADVGLASVYFAFSGSRQLGFYRETLAPGKSDPWTET